MYDPEHLPQNLTEKRFLSNLKRIFSTSIKDDQNVLCSEDRFLVKKKNS